MYNPQANGKLLKYMSHSMLDAHGASVTLPQTNSIKMLKYRREKSISHMKR